MGVSSKTSKIEKLLWNLRSKTIHIPKKLIFSPKRGPKPRPFWCSQKLDLDPFWPLFGPLLTSFLMSWNTHIQIQQYGRTNIPCLSHECIILEYGCPKMDQKGVKIWVKKGSKTVILEVRNPKNHLFKKGINYFTTGINWKWKTRFFNHFFNHNFSIIFQNTKN